MDVIQADLKRMKSTWNIHRIRANKVSSNGIPDYLYYLPEHRGRHEVNVFHSTYCYLSEM